MEWELLTTRLTSRNKLTLFFLVKIKMYQKRKRNHLIIDLKERYFFVSKTKAAFRLGVRAPRLAGTSLNRIFR